MHTDQYLAYSIISLLAVLGDFGGRPPPVILVSLLNSANSFLAMLWRFFHLSFASVTVRLAVPTAFTTCVISSHNICFFLLVTAFVNLDWIKSRFFWHYRWWLQSHKLKNSAFFFCLTFGFHFHVPHGSGSGSALSLSAIHFTPIFFRA